MRNVKVPKHVQLKQTPAIVAIKALDGKVGKMPNQQENVIIYANQIITHEQEKSRT